MPLLPDDWIQELLRRIDIREVVEKYVPLEPKGKRLWARCPFHNEKTPSFSVTPEQGMFYCYGCHKGGTAIQFISAIEKINFREACEKLADGCGLELPSDAYTREQQVRRSKTAHIKNANKAAAHYFVDMLHTPEGRAAMGYLHDRGLTDDDIRRNGIGFAPDAWQKMGDALALQGFDSDLLVDAGLRKRSKERTYDVFRGRIMFPIIDTDRSVVGFGGRVMDDSLPKYLNTPETSVFSKRRQMYHLNVVRQIRKVEYLVLMEGYMDVISADRFGIRNCVATLGTALTVEQARLLRRWNVPVYICYDGDAPGQKATERAIGILNEAGVPCRVLALPNGMDPDELLRSKGRDAFDRSIRWALDPVSFLFSRARQNLDLENPDDKERYVEACVAVLREQQSAVTRERFGRVLAEQTGYSLDSILRDAEQISAEKAPIEAVKLRADASRSSTEIRAENYLALYASVYPQDYVRNSRRPLPTDFDFHSNAAIIAAVESGMERGLQPTPEYVLAVLEDQEDRSHAARLYSNIERLHSMGHRPEEYVAGCAMRLVLRRKERERDAALQTLKECTDAAKRRTLKAEVQELAIAIQEMRRELPV